MERKGSVCQQPPLERGGGLPLEVARRHSRLAMSSARATLEVALLVARRLTPSLRRHVSHPQLPLGVGRRPPRFPFLLIFILFL
jgi:hypothetical protein